MRVSWDDDIPNIWKNKIHVPNHQSGYHHLTIYLVGGFNHLEKYKFVNGKDDIPIPYMKWTNKSHVPNHQSVVYQLYYIWINHGKSWEVIYSWMFLLRILYDHYIATIISPETQHPHPNRLTARRQRWRATLDLHRDLSLTLSHPLQGIPQTEGFTVVWLIYG